MTEMDEYFIRILRTQAWERAKGELRSVAQTFFGDSASRPGQFGDYGADSAARPGQFGDYDNLMEKFINDVESRGLHE